MEERMEELKGEIEEIEDIVTEVKNENDLQSLTNNADFQKMWAKMHTPWKRRANKIGRNDVCPFCNSGKKFKNCECYSKYKLTPPYTINY